MRRRFLFAAIAPLLFAGCFSKSDREMLQNTARAVEYQGSRIDTLEALVTIPDPIYLPDTVIFAGSRIPTENNMVRLKLTEAIRLYVGTLQARKRFSGYLIQMQHYGPYWDSAFTAAGYSTDYTSIPIVESGLNPRARSRVGAEGPWQIMPRTGRACGLTINAVVDERRNIERALVCAIRHIAGSDSAFHDPSLNVAAFNKGNGGVQSALQENRVTSFYNAVFVRQDGGFNIETMDYVYRVIAVNLIRSNPERYFVRDVLLENNRFDVVIYEVRRRTTLIELANRFSVPPAIFLHMNPQFETNDIPRGRYIIVAPRSSAQ